MSTKIPFEPFTFWKSLYDETEKAWHDVIQDTLGQESFAQNLGQVQASYLQFHEATSEWMNLYLKQTNLPTRDEIANVAQLVIQVENKVDALEETFEDMDASYNEQIVELKQSIASLDQKLDLVLQSLEKLQKTPTKAAPKQSPANSATKNK